MIKLIVGVGNPGLEYELTRHNIAWIFLDGHPEIRSKIWKTKFKGEYTDFTEAGEKIYVLKPQTYMNLSGESVQPLCQFFKKGGGLAGHNGLKSIAKHLGTDNFYRMRIGIGRPVHGSVSSWVLSKIPSSMDTELNLVMDKSTEALSSLLRDGIKKASNQFNKKDFLALN